MICHASSGTLSSTHLFTDRLSGGEVALDTQQVKSSQAVSALVLKTHSKQEKVHVKNAENKLTLIKEKHLTQNPKLNQQALVYL